MNNNSNGQIILIDNINRRIYINDITLIDNPVIEAYLINLNDSTVNQNQQYNKVVNNNVENIENSKIGYGLVERVKELLKQVLSLSKIVKSFKI